MECLSLERDSSIAHQTYIENFPLLSLTMLHFASHMPMLAIEYWHGSLKYHKSLYRVTTEIYGIRPQIPTMNLGMMVTVTFKLDLWLYSWIFKHFKLIGDKKWKKGRSFDNEYRNQRITNYSSVIVIRSITSSVGRVRVKSTRRLGQHWYREWSSTTGVE